MEQARYILTPPLPPMPGGLNALMSHIETSANKKEFFMSKKNVSDTKKVVVKSLVDAGLPYREISETVGVSLGYITEIVKEFEASKELVAWFKQNKGDILLKAQAENLALQDMIRKTVTKEEIETWTPDQRQRWYSALGINFGIVFDKSRLENDESSSNLKILVAHIQAAQ